MHLKRSLALVGAAAAGILAACGEIPFAPKWDADMYVPLSTKAIYLKDFFAYGFIPPNQSGTVNFSPLTQPLNSTIGGVLKKVVTDPARARSVLTLTIGKTTAIAAQDTLVIARDSAGLSTFPSGTIVFPFGLAVADGSKTDSMSLSLIQINMLQTTAQTCDLALGCQPLWIQMRGRVSNPSASIVTVTPADSLGIKLTMTVRVAISGKPNQ
jgi:hypothetical protein